MPVNDIETEKTTATKKTQTATSQILDYLATHPDATIRFYASDMILHIHSDASYLSVSKARSRLGGLFYLWYNPPQLRQTQWVYPQRSFCHQKCRCISSRIRSWRVPPKCPKCSPTSNHFDGIGAQAIGDASSHGQLYCLRNFE
jgi:hypothetical protein